MVGMICRNFVKRRGRIRRIYPYDFFVGYTFQHHFDVIEFDGIAFDEYRFVAHNSHTHGVCVCVQ